MKNYTTLGALIGAALAIAIVLGNWAMVLLIIVLGGIGGLIGAHFDGRINLVEIWNSVIGKGQG